MLKVAVIGLGGYGLVHIDAVHWLQRQGLARLGSVIALAADRQKHPALVSRLEREGVTLFDDLEQFFAAGAAHTDVLTVPIGIHEHVPVSIRALAAGLHVYCEKPVAATVQEVDALIAAREDTHRLVQIGFQQIFSYSIQQLKKRICSGTLGPVRHLTLIAGWPRSLQYYSRNEWAGKLRFGDNWVLDSPANNALAHYLLCALYLFSNRPDKAEIPVRLQAELYRANPIEGPDTVQMKLTMPAGRTAHVLLTHANARANGPRMQIECDSGDVWWQGDIGETQIRYQSGREASLSNQTHAQWRFEGFKNLIAAIQEREELHCPPELARPQTLVINAMHDSCPEIRQVPDPDVLETEDWEMFPPGTRGTFRRIKKLDELMAQAVEKDLFFSEMGVPWARPGAVIALENYHTFPGRAAPGGSSSLV